MDTTALEVLLPKTKQITICGKAVIIKPLTLRQLIAAFTIMGASRADISMPPGSSDQAVMLKVFSAVGDYLPDLVSIFTGEPVEAVRDLPLEDASELVVALCEINDFEKVFANFQKAMDLTKTKK